MTERRRFLGLFRVGDMPTGRIEAFSDSVFAVAVTLLVLEVHIPQIQGPDISAALVHGLLAQGPKFLSYVLSFAIICIWWVAHHHLLHLLTRSDRGLLWLNSLFLLWLTFIPFPTALMGDYPHEPIAVASYGAVTAMAAICFTLMRYYAFYVGNLVDETIDRGLMKHAMLRSFTNIIMHIVATALAFVDTRVAITFYVLLPVMFIIPNRLDRHIHKKTQ